MATQATGQRPPPLRICPTEPISLSFATHWYRFPTDDRFLICTKCYEDKVHHLTPLANALRCDYLDFGPRVVVTCDFSTPRIDALLKQAVATNDFQPLQSFAERRCDVQPCAGTIGVRGGSGMVWFKPVDEASLPSFVCCKACFEDVAMGTSFGSRFIRHPQQQPIDQNWSCDLAVPFLRQRLQDCARRGDWVGFTGDCHRRMSLPSCQIGVSTMASAKRWFNTIRPFPIPSMSVCEACFLDQVGWQEDIAPRFAPINFTPFELTNRFTCDFQPAPMAACSNILLAHGKFDRWHQVMSVVLSKPACSNQGIVDGEWYGLPDPANPSRNVENFEICAVCHAGWKQSAGWAHLFRRIDYPPGTTRVCDLNASSPRHAQYVQKWTEMYLTHDPTSFINFVSRCAFLPTCQGTRRLTNAKWYGDEASSLFICPSCFEEVIRDTPLAASLPLQNTLLPAEHHCSLYSARMREKYAEACKQHSLTSLLHFATHREQIYQQTQPSLEAFRARQQQLTEQLMTATRMRAQAVQTTTMARGFTGLGPPIVHNYDPAVVMFTINIDKMRNDLASDPQRPQMMQLEALWRDVE